MSGKSYMLKQRELRDNEIYKTSERITRQYDVDTLQIALSRYKKLNLGYERIMKICELWEEVKEEYSNALECMDRELRQIMSHRAGNLIPAEKRYPELRKPM